MDVAGWAGVALVVVTIAIDMFARARKSGATERELAMIKEQMADRVKQRDEEAEDERRFREQVHLTHSQIGLRIDAIGQDQARFREKVAADNVRHEHLHALESRINKSIEGMGAQVRRDIDGLITQQRELGQTIVTTVRDMLRKST